MTSPGPRPLDQLAPMDDATVQLVRRSCARLPEDPLVLTQRFYAHLFAMAPQARALFSPDLRLQEERLLKALVAAVNALDRPEVLERQLRLWGAYHRQVHGITDDLYVYVGHALVRAVREVLGGVESSVCSAWIAVYEWLAATMIAGADAAESEAAAAPSGAGAGEETWGPASVVLDQESPSYSRPLHHA